MSLILPLINIYNEKSWLKVICDVERKIYFIIRNNYLRGRSPSISEISIRSGYNQERVQQAIEYLIKHYWIGKDENEWVILRNME